MFLLILILFLLLWFWGHVFLPLSRLPALIIPILSHSFLHMLTDLFRWDFWVNRQVKFVRKVARTFSDLQYTHSMTHLWFTLRLSRQEKWVLTTKIMNGGQILQAVLWDAVSRSGRKGKKKEARISRGLPQTLGLFYSSSNWGSEHLTQNPIYEKSVPFGTFLHLLRCPRNKY